MKKKIVETSESEAKEEVKDSKKQKNKVLSLKRIHLVDENNDIKYHGPLSYRYLRLIGWVFFLIAQLGMVIGMCSNIRGGDLGEFPTVLKSFSSVMSPLFLIAAFSQVLNAKDGYRRQFITYGAAALGIFLAFLFLYEYYIINIFAALGGDRTSGRSVASLVTSFLNSNGSLTFNIFIDLLLFTLLTFFINYKPQKYFQGKKIIIFRLFAILPVLYELGSIAIKILVNSDIFHLPPHFFPLLTTKPPVGFLIFIALAFFFKIRERRFLKNGKTHEDYKKFLNTNVNKLHFSIFLSICIVIAVIIDAILFIVVGALRTGVYSQITGDPNAAAPYALSEVYGWGFGKTLPMIFVIPLVILFDYKKTHKDSLPDMIIPAVGIAITVFIYVEGLYEVVRLLVTNFSSQIRDVVDGGGEEEGGEEVAQTIYRVIQYFKK